MICFLITGDVLSRTSSEPRSVRFARELLYFLLTIEILFLISGVSVTLALLSDKVALLGDYETGPSYDRPDRTAQVIGCAAQPASITMNKCTFYLKLAFHCCILVFGRHETCTENPVTVF